MGTLILCGARGSVWQIRFLVALLSGAVGFLPVSRIGLETGATTNDPSDRV